MEAGQRESDDELTRLRRENAELGRSVVELVEQLGRKDVEASALRGLLLNWLQGGAPVEATNRLVWSDPAARRSS